MPLRNTINTVWLALLGLFATAPLRATPLPTAEHPDTTARPQWLPRQSGFKPTIKGMVQLWGIHSTGFEVYDAATGSYTPVDDRINLSLRRARVVLSGTPYNRLQYTVALFYDQIGRDVLSSAIGAANKSEPAVGIWDAYLVWKPLPDSEALNVVGGWFRPQIQRESITSGWSVNAFEKATSQIYLRSHLVGNGSGRASGINVGGLVTKADAPLRIPHRQPWRGRRRGAGQRLLFASRRRCHPPRRLAGAGAERHFLTL